MAGIWIALGVLIGAALALRYKFGAALAGSVLLAVIAAMASAGGGAAYAAGVGLASWAALQIGYVAGAWVNAARARRRSR